MPGDGLTLCTMRGGVRAFLDAPLPEGGAALCWLGQSGFALRHGDLLYVIDPYLSDHLAVKYGGTDKPHARMMAAPVAPDGLRGVDYVLCTHRHSDHLDPGTLPGLAKANPQAEFVVPRAAWQAAVDAGTPRERIVAVDAGDRERLGPDAELLVLASAHEELAKDETGHYPCLGYVLLLGRLAVYHAGDTVPYAGLAERLRGAGVDLALLPVNGRDATRRRQGMAGNMDFEEAALLCERARIPYLVGHHFGMFAHNTVDEAALRDGADAYLGETQCVIPSVDAYYLLS